MSRSTFAHDSEFSFFVQWVRSHASHIRKANSMRERVGEIQLIGVFSFNWPLNVEADFVIIKTRSTNNMGFDFHATTITLTEQQSRTFMCTHVKWLTVTLVFHSHSSISVIVAVVSRSHKQVIFLEHKRQHGIDSAERQSSLSLGSNIRSIHSKHGWIEIRKKCGNQFRECWTLGIGWVNEKDFIQNLFRKYLAANRTFER